MTAPTQQLKDVANNVRGEAKDVAGNVRSEAKNVASTVQSEAKEYLQDGQEWLGEADETIRQAMREHPIACLFVALGIGYSIGRLIAKR